MGIVKRSNTKCGSLMAPHKGAPVVPCDLPIHLNSRQKLVARLNGHGHCAALDATPCEIRSLSSRPDK
jgi:hypothetical protein